MKIKKKKVLSPREKIIKFRKIFKKLKKKKNLGNFQVPIFKFFDILKVFYPRLIYSFQLTSFLIIYF